MQRANAPVLRLSSIMSWGLWTRPLPSNPPPGVISWVWPEGHTMLHKMWELRCCCAAAKHFVMKLWFAEKSETMQSQSLLNEKSTREQLEGITEDCPLWSTVILYDPLQSHMISCDLMWFPVILCDTLTWDITSILRGDVKRASPVTTALTSHYTFCTL